MSFTNINGIKSDDSTRSVAMLYNFNDKEVISLKSACRIFGIKDVEVLSRNNAATRVIDVVNGEVASFDEEGVNHKAIVFNNVSSAKVNGLIDGLKKLKLGRPLMAFVTEDNAQWTFNNLLLNLIEERNALQQGKASKH